jgi:predicted nucleotidyltransferase
MSVSDKLKLIAEEYCQKLLRENGSIEGVFLIGSVARGEAVEGSDIDLLIIDKEIDLNSDQQDNMREIAYKGEVISSIRTNLPKLQKNIREGITADICFAKEAIPLYDPKNLTVKIKNLIRGFSFNINLVSRVENAISGLNDAKRFLKRGEEEKVRMIALTTAFFLTRGFIQYHNSPYTSAKKIFGELEKIDEKLGRSFKTIWVLTDSRQIIKELNFQIKRIRKFIHGLETRSNSS